MKTNVKIQNIGNTINQLFTLKASKWRQHFKIICPWPFKNGFTIILRLSAKLSEILFLSYLSCALSSMINYQIESDISQSSQIIVRPFEFESSFECQKKKINYVMCYMSLVTCVMFGVKFHMSNIASHISPFPCHQH